MTKIGIICDMHLPDDRLSPQFAFLQMAAAQMKKDGVDTIICLGDITSFGEIGALELYQEVVKDFVHYEVAGNSDVRDETTRERILSGFLPAEFTVGNRRLIGLNTPDAVITEADRERLACIKPGDVIFLHHYIRKMSEESGSWLTELAEKVPVTIVHGHGHRSFDYYIKESHVLGMRGLDPDKSIGNFPCINYLNVTEDAVAIEEVQIRFPKSYFKDCSRFFGLSCVNNRKDVAYALEHSVKYVELRCNGKDWKPDHTLFPTLMLWKKKTDGYLSVHMPNLYFRAGEIHGEEQWREALAYAVQVGVNNLTIHPPRVRVCDMPKDGEVWNRFLELYLLVVRSVPANVRIGIENLHKSPDEKLDESRGFGYRPEEVSDWIDAINACMAKQDGVDEKFPHVGHVLDVGHARNNGTFAQRFPSSAWYRIMGRKAVAYHIHQVKSGEGGMRNHCALEDWFGPSINYTSFFYGWNHGLLNHAPVFLEVKGSENYGKSIAAFREILQSLE